MNLYDILRTPRASIDGMAVALLSVPRRERRDRPTAADDIYIVRTMPALRHAKCRCLSLGSAVPPPSVEYILSQNGHPRRSTESQTEAKD